MTYIQNPFKVGQYAQCINDNFPVVETTGDKSQIGTHPLKHPKKGEICCVDEILGEYLRFDEYDCINATNPDYGWNWWKHTHFKPLTMNEVEEHYEQVGKNLVSMKLDSLDIILDWFEHEKKQMNPMCKKHKPVRAPYLMHMEYLEEKYKQGHRQEQCPKCGYWLFPWEK